LDVNWNDPRSVSLHERLAATIQRELEDSIMGGHQPGAGLVADAEHFGTRAASEILRAARGADFARRTWSLAFEPDPEPSRNNVIGCLTCDAHEGDLHGGDCHRRGVLRRGRVAL
jgi:hypothetical protein